MPAADDSRKDADEATPKGAKPRKRPATKAPTEPAGKRSLNLRINTESYRRLSVHALMNDTTISALVEAFALSLRDYSMPHRLKAETSDDIEAA